MCVLLAAGCLFDILKDPNEHEEIGAAQPERLHAMLAASLCSDFLTEFYQTLSPQKSAT